MAQSLYRKYRPKTFEDLVGQDHIRTTIENAVGEDSLAHAYLFCGPRGTGKTTVARLLAKALLCEKGPTMHPDGTCEECEEIAEGTHPDVHELDAASRTGVDAVREEIIGRVQFAPTRGKYKVYIIDEVHMLSTAAFNALLKTLEEPPAHVVFIMCTTHPHKVPDTIQSRCQRFDFHRIPERKIADNLRMISEGEGYTADKEALLLIAQHATGGMRDAITTLEQVAAFTGGTITVNDVEELIGEVDEEQLFTLSKAVAQRDMATCFSCTAELANAGVDITQFAKEYTAHMRDLYVVAVTGGLEGIVDADAKSETRLKALVKEFEDPDRLARALEILGDLSQELKDATDPRLRLEVALVRIARPGGDLTLEALSQRISALERGLSVADGAQTPTASMTSSAQYVRQDSSQTGLVDTDQKTDQAKSESVESKASEAPETKAKEPIESEEAASPAEDVSDPIESQPDSAPQVSATDEVPIDLSAARRGWTAVLAEMKRKKPSRAAMFSIATIDIAPDGALLIVFPAEQAFSASQINDRPEYRSFVSETLNEVFKRTIVFRASVGGETPAIPDYPLPALTPEEIEAIGEVEIEEPGDYIPTDAASTEVQESIAASLLDQDEDIAGEGESTGSGDDSSQDAEALAEDIQGSTETGDSLESMLAAGFGEGVVIEGVEETDDENKTDE